MTQATKFYLPFFKTNYPNGKLYTYISGTSTLTPTYKDAAGTLNTNPIIMDSKGQCVIYINSDISYRYVLKDANDNIIYDESNIKQLNGEPGAPGGPVGPAGKKGKTGVQGVSGGQGPVGFTGATGEKGLPYLTKLTAINGQTINIPIGVSEIYLTATGGGGAAASWSPYVFLMRQKDTTLADSTVNPTATIAGGTQTSTVPLKFIRNRFSGFMFLPGTGMSGKSVYRKKISLDPTIANVVQIFLGNAGTYSNTSLNGGDGTATEVYVNTVKVLSLDGGLGGKNQFPKNSAGVPAFPTDGTAIRLNRGHKNGMLYFNQNGGDTISYPSEGQKLNVWNTTYKKTSGGTFTLEPVNLGYYCPIPSINVSNVGYNIITTHNVDNGRGGENIFGSLYGNRQRLDQVIGVSQNEYTTSTKQTSGEQGWGAGGDIFWDYTTSQGAGNYATYNRFIPTSATGMGVTYSNLVVFNEPEIKAAVRAYYSSFNVATSFTPGVLDLPLDSNTSGVWNGIQAVRNTIDANPSTYSKFTTSGFYYGQCIRIPIATSLVAGNSGSGTPGAAFIEYGNITEYFPAP